MENLIIKETKYTPEVKFNANEGILNMVKANNRGLQLFCACRVDRFLQ